MHIPKSHRPIVKLVIASFTLTAFAAALAARAPSGNFLVVDGVVGDKFFILKIIGVAAGIIAVNSLLAWFLVRRERFLSHLLSGASLLFAGLLLAKVAITLYA